MGLGGGGLVEAVTSPLCMSPSGDSLLPCSTRPTGAIWIRARWLSAARTRPCAVLAGCRAGGSPSAARAGTARCRPWSRTRAPRSSSRCTTSPRRDESTLDGWEGADQGLYRKVRVRVATLDGEQPAWVYVLDDFEGGIPSARTLGTAGRRRRSRRCPGRLRRRIALPTLHQRLVAVTTEVQSAERPSATTVRLIGRRRRGEKPSVRKTSRAMRPNSCEPASRSPRSILPSCSGRLVGSRRRSWAEIGRCDLVRGSWLCASDRDRARRRRCAWFVPPPAKWRRYSPDGPICTRAGESDRWSTRSGLQPPPAPGSWCSPMAAAASTRTGPRARRC